MLSVRVLVGKLQVEPSSSNIDLKIFALYNLRVVGPTSLHTTRLKSFGKIHGGRVERESVAPVIGIVQETIKVEALQDITSFESAKVEIKRFVWSGEVTEGSTTCARVGSRRLLLLRR